MTCTTHTARITGPVPYLVRDGLCRNIPLGPCLVERHDSLVDIVWGARGQNCAALPADVMSEVENHGYLVLLD